MQKGHRDWNNMTLVSAIQSDSECEGGIQPTVPNTFIMYSHAMLVFDLPIMQQQCDTLLSGGLVSRSRAVIAAQIEPSEAE